MKTTFRTGLQPSVYENTYELHFYMQSYIIDFIAANRQFDWLEISLMYDTSDQYTMIYDSCNAELAAKKIGRLTVENNTNSRILNIPLLFQCEQPESQSQKQT